MKKRQFVKAVTIILVFLSVITDSGKSQETLSLPGTYFSLKNENDKMVFLVKAISDSLDDDRLTHVLEWSRIGLEMAQRNKVDTMKGIFCFFIGKAFAYKYGKPDSAIFYYKKVLPYFPDRNRKYNIFSVREIMERYSELGNKDSSFVYLDTLKAFIDTMPETSPKRISLSQNIATVYQWFGMFKTAIRYYQVAVNGNRISRNMRGLGLALANLGELYDESGDDIKAVQYAKEGLGYLSDVNMPYMQTASNIATYYKNLEQFDSALVYYKRAEELAVKINDTQQQITLRSVLGEIYLDQKELTLAEPLLKNNIPALIESGNRWVLVKTYFSIASLDSSLHNYREAKDNLLKGLKIAQEDKQEVLIAIGLQSLAAISSKLNEDKAAFNYLNQFIQQKDSMTNQRTKAEMADLEISYKTLQKEQEISLLKKDNDIKTLQLQSNRRSLFFYLAGFLMLLGIAGILFYQRNERNKMHTQKIKAELQNQILRSQMNPHFIFNSLNSIENFIMQNDRRQASDYLNKFSKLIRSILESSRNEVVPLAKDLEVLKLYVELEQLRFNNKFTYHTHIDPQLLEGDYRVPSLLIQPYLENAIIHGVGNSINEDLQLTVTAALDGEKIKYTIQDNGIGRSKAAEYNLQNKPKHKSIGLQITAERIAQFNGDENMKEAIVITDLYNDHAEANGTKVEIQIKAA